MDVWKLCAVVLLLSPTFRAQDTVEEDRSAHQLESLVMLLTLTECEELVEALSTPDQDIFKRLERLAPENNQLSLQQLSKRSLLSDQGSEEKCKKALTDWLLENGEEMYYDRLTRSLQHIGRTDVALEMTKKFNEDKLLSLTRYVEDYHKTVSSFNVPEGPTEAKETVKVRDLSSKNLDLILTRAPVPPYSKGPWHVIQPILYGFLISFCIFLLPGVCMVCLFIRRHQQLNCNVQCQTTNNVILN